MGLPIRGSVIWFFAFLVAAILLAVALFPNVKPMVSRVLFDNPLVFLRAPTITQSPNSAAPLNVIVEFETDIPVKASYTISDNDDTWTYTSEEFLAYHQQPLLRFRAGKDHKIAITITDKKGRSHTAGSLLSFQAPSLPTTSDIPELAVKSSKTIIDSGLTIVSLFNYDSNIDESGSGLDINREFSLLLALDKNHEVVWFYKADYLVKVIEQQTPGTLTLISAKGRETIDFLGNRIDFWQGARQKNFLGSLRMG